MYHRFSPVSSISFMLCVCYFIKFTLCFDDPAYLPNDVSISCGSAGTSAPHDGRQWLGDTHPRFSSSVQIKGKSTISSVARDDPVPYKTARISRSEFSYVFLVKPGEKFIRLYFNPIPYKGFRKYKDLFTVEAGPFTLLSNFSASLTADALGLSSFVKEFCISGEENQPLHIVFTPAVSHSGDTYAFLNGIEIITVPLGHSYFHADGDIGAQVVGRKSRINVDSSTALEMVRRVNIIRDGYVSSGDVISYTFGMLATVAKEKENLINNITWKISVDVGFRYLARLHFSNVGLKTVQETGFVNFKILIDEMIVYNNIDFARERDTNNMMTYKDYMVMSKGRKGGVKHNILVSLQLYGEFIDGYGPFTGFEILKLSKDDNSLAGSNPSPAALDSPSSTVQILLRVLGHRNAIVTMSLTIIALANIIVHKLREIWEDSCTEEEIKPSARAERFCRRFTLAEIQLATKNFSYHLIIGKGGFGNVYKGLIDNGKVSIAAKRLKFDSRQGAHEFLAEIETLSELRHNNLVSLIGYCNEQREMILVYEYMAGGTLGDYLYKLESNGDSCASLTWKQRLNICIGAGRGLDYLHTGHGVIHRDVKASNILLDENFTPKVSDFGLVKHENLSNLQSHVSTEVKGTFGYLDPTYLRTCKLTRKSDTYAFGVVLLEVLCGRRALDRRLSEAEQILTKWARDKIREGEVELIVASNLKKEISPNSLNAFVEVVEKCLDDEPKKRPTMAQVVLQLEFALEQQDILEQSVPKEIMIDAPCSDEADLSVGELAEHTSTSPPIEQTVNQIDYEIPPSWIKEGRKAPFYKQIWPWDALWKKLKPSRRNGDLILSAGSSQHRWTQRFKIIMGIARGVAYPHLDSGMRIVHRNLCQRSILLDIAMNPRIARFYKAKTMEEDYDESLTTTVRGTTGYCCPKYLRTGKFSIKTDVYSFGVVVLEIVRGGVSCFFVDELDKNPILLARKLWKEGKASDLVDVLAPAEEVLRCIQVGLLCTLSNSRPTMHRVIKILEGEEYVDLQEMELLLRQEQYGSDEDWTPNDSLQATSDYDITMER